MLRVLPGCKAGGTGCAWGTTQRPRRSGPQPGLHSKLPLSGPRPGVPPLGSAPTRTHQQAQLAHVAALLGEGACRREGHAVQAAKLAGLLLVLLLCCRQAVGKHVGRAGEARGTVGSQARCGAFSPAERGSQLGGPAQPAWVHVRRATSRLRPPRPCLACRAQLQDQLLLPPGLQLAQRQAGAAQLLVGRPVVVRVQDDGQLLVLCGTSAPRGPAGGVPTPLSWCSSSSAARPPRTPIDMHRRAGRLERPATMRARRRAGLQPAGACLAR